MLPVETRQARSRMASAAAVAKRRPGDHDAAVTAADARRDFFAKRLEDHINQAVAAAPPLTREQRERLAAILRGGGDLHGAA